MRNSGNVKEKKKFKANLLLKVIEFQNLFYNFPKSLFL